MAGLRLELLPLLVVVVLTGHLPLLTASPRGWEWIDNAQLSTLLESGELGSPSVSSSSLSSWTDDDRGEEEEDEPIPEDELPEFEEEEGVATGNLNANTDHGFQVESEDSEYWANNVDGGFQMSFVDSSEDGTDDGLDSTETDSDSSEFDSSPFPRSVDQPKVKEKCTKPTTEPSKAQNCVVPAGEQVTCGDSGITPADCEKMGCCVCPTSSACFYPLDECTGDQHFVFAIRYNSANIPVDPTKLVIPGYTDCKAVIVNDKVAIFKFKVTECGVRAYEVGETKIYLAEVQTIVQALNLKYGIITRSDPLRFLVECRYSKDGSAQQGLASAGVMVKVPSSTLPSSITSGGLYAVLLRIAKDKTYSSFLPTYHQPLRLLLGKPVYLELYLYSPVPYATVLVNYCLAYPRSAKNALLLIYEGCANPLDKSVSILKVSDLPQNRNRRRFLVTAFQFMSQVTNKYLNEEIYFMCSTEVCFSNERSCEERCFDGKTP
ncbi:zona pellucida sperm-binding protein 4-like [Solea solea]|uniref:zona pellucida sperm-binding protein 4-like n=1 Tax=Solea solea TaxID=90069 RepID=UPI00272CB31D|nr:zona pellucida sperm-binding protein 4-like [Solea solea]